MKSYAVFIRVSILKIIELKRTQIVSEVLPTDRLTNKVTQLKKTDPLILMSFVQLAILMKHILY